MSTTKKKHLGKRILAFFIDYGLMFLLTMTFIYKYGIPDETGAYTVQGIKAFIPCIYWFLYFVVIEGLTKATIGHFLLGLKIKKINNENIKIIDSLKRHLLDPIDFFFFGLPAIICIQNTKTGQRIGDLWARTIVIDNKNE